MKQSENVGYKNLSSKSYMQSRKTGLDEFGYLTTGNGTILFHNHNICIVLKEDITLYSVYLGLYEVLSPDNITYNFIIPYQLPFSGTAHDQLLFH